MICGRVRLEAETHRPSCRDALLTGMGMGGKDVGVKAMVAKTYWEDLKEGQKLPCKTVKIKKAEIRAFAQKYDPQPFHVDERAARNSIFGGLIASALHTLSACTRAVVDAQGNVAILSGLGLDEA